MAAALVTAGLNVFAWHGATDDEYNAHISETLSHQANIIIDDGGDLVHMLHTSKKDQLQYVIGGCEETTTGIIRLQAMDAAGQLEFPMVLVNNADCKHLLTTGMGQDSLYGMGLTGLLTLLLQARL